MAARAHDVRDNTASLGAAWTLPMLDRAKTAFCEDEPSSGVTSEKRSVRSRAVGWFLFAIAVIASSSALAWRGYAEIHSISERRANDVHELQASIQRLELAHQQIAQRVEALQQAQQQHENSRLGDVQRLSLQLMALQGEVEKVAKKNETEQKAVKSEPRPATRKKNDVSSTAASSRTRSVARDGASEPSSKPAVEERN
jgi:hypothetical protein